MKEQENQELLGQVLIPIIKLFSFFLKKKTEAAMSGPKVFKILLDNNSSAFFGGQNVGGVVHIENVSTLEDIKGTRAL